MILMLASKVNAAAYGPVHNHSSRTFPTTLSPPAAPPGPRLPQELLDAVITHVGPADLSTLQTCVLVGPRLRAKAQQLLFSRVTLKVECEQSDSAINTTAGSISSEAGSEQDNLLAMTECFQTTSLGRHVRAVTVKGVRRSLGGGDPTSYPPVDDERLVRVLSLLASQGPAAGATPTTGSQSRISSLVLDNLRTTSSQLLRLACAFPILTEFECRECVDAADAGALADEYVGMLEELPVSRTDPPRLTSLAFVRCRVSLPLHGLFPTSEDVWLRSIEFEPNKASEYPHWLSLIRRAGAGLEHLVLDFTRLEPHDMGRINLSANPNLHTLWIFCTTINAASSTWLLPLLNTLKSCALQRLIFDDCTFDMTCSSSGMFALLMDVDQALSDEGAFKELECVAFVDAVLHVYDAVCFREWAKEWLPGLFRRGILHSQDTRVEMKNYHGFYTWQDV